MKQLLINYFFSGDSDKICPSLLIYEIVADVLINRPNLNVLYVDVYDRFDAQICAKIVKKHRLQNSTHAGDELERLMVVKILDRSKFNLLMRRLNDLPKMSLFVVDFLGFYYQNKCGFKNFGQAYTRKAFVQQYIKKFNDVAKNFGFTTLVTLPSYLIKTEAEFFGGTSNNFELNDKRNSSNYANKTKEQNQRELGAGLTIFLSPIGNKSIYKMKIRGNDYNDVEEYYCRINDKGYEWKLKTKE